MQSTATSHHYCYDVNVTRPVTTMSRLLTGSWSTQRLCCRIATNGTASASFLPRVVLPPPAYADNTQVSEHSRAVTLPIKVSATVTQFIEDTVEPWGPIHRKSYDKLRMVGWLIGV